MSNQCHLFSLAMSWRDGLIVHIISVCSSCEKRIVAIIGILDWYIPAVAILDNKCLGILIMSSSAINNAPGPLRNDKRQEMVN